MDRRAFGVLGAAGLLVSLVASIGPAAKAVVDSFEFLWPGGVVALLALICAMLGLLLWRKQSAAQADLVGRDGRETVAGTREEPVVGTFASGGVREKCEAAYGAILPASEAYINAHRQVLTVDGGDAYFVRQVEAAMDLANHRFVLVRQQLEQHGAKSVLDATLDLEAAVNRNELDLAARLRRDYLVPVVREEMERLSAASWTGVP
jgi:hypothetical protein